MDRIGSAKSKSSIKSAKNNDLNLSSNDTRVLNTEILKEDDLNKFNSSFIQSNEQQSENPVLNNNNEDTEPNLIYTEHKFKFLIDGDDEQDISENLDLFTLLNRLDGPERPKSKTKIQPLNTDENEEKKPEPKAKRIEIFDFDHHDLDEHDKPLKLDRQTTLPSVYIDPLNENHNWIDEYPAKNKYKNISNLPSLTYRAYGLPDPDKHKKKSIEISKSTELENKNSISRMNNNSSRNSKAIFLINDFQKPKPRTKMMTNEEIFNSIHRLNALPKRSDAFTRNKTIHDDPNLSNIDINAVSLRLFSSNSILFCLNLRLLEVIIF